MIAPLIAAAGVALLVGALWAVGRSKYGQLYLGELPGFLFILAAGRSYRRQAAAILASRDKHATTTASGVIRLPSRPCPPPAPPASKPQRYCPAHHRYDYWHTTPGGNHQACSRCGCTQCDL